MRSRRETSWVGHFSQKNVQEFSPVSLSDSTFSAGPAIKLLQARSKKFVQNFCANLLGSMKNGPLQWTSGCVFVSHSTIVSSNPITAGIKD